MNADDVRSAEQRWHRLSLQEQDEWGHHADPRRAFIAATLADALAARPDVLLALLSDREPGPRDTREALTARLDRLRAERDTRRAEQVETAARVLHDLRHRAGTSHVCDRCREDAIAVAAALTAPTEET